LKLTVQKSQLQGTVKIPPSKSHTICAVAIGSLANGQSTIRNPLNSSDTTSAVNCYNALSAKIDTSDPNDVQILLKHENRKADWLKENPPE